MCEGERRGHLSMLLFNVLLFTMQLEMDTHQTQLLKIGENLQTVQQSSTQHAIVSDEVRLWQDVLDEKTTKVYIAMSLLWVRGYYETLSDILGKTSFT